MKKHTVNKKVNSLTAKAGEILASKRTAPYIPSPKGLGLTAQMINYKGEIKDERN